MIVNVKNLIKRYGDLLALDNFNMKIEEGEILGLLGPNGSGKTTAINCILSLLKYNKGEIEVFDKKITSNSYDLKARIGLVPQELAIIETLTVEENIDFFCGLYVYNKKERKKLVEEAIDFVKLDSHRKFYPKKLSGGLKRRLNIACGIAHKPDLLIFDEPTVAIDAQSRNFILDGIKKLNKNGASILYTSHYLEEVEHLCNRIVIMDKGNSIAEGSKEELVNLLPTGDIVEVEFLEDAKTIENTVEKIKTLDNFLNITVDKNICKISFKNAISIIEDFIKFLKENNLAYKNLNFSKPSLNEVFLYLTGKELREWKLYFFKLNIFLSN